MANQLYLFTISEHPKNLIVHNIRSTVLSTEEAIAAGVQLIGIRMLFDQWSITEKYKRYGIGLQLDFSSITEDTFRKAIQTVTGNKRSVFSCQIDKFKNFCRVLY